MEIFSFPNFSFFTLTRASRCRTSRATFQLPDRTKKSPLQFKTGQKKMLFLVTGHSVCTPRRRHHCPCRCLLGDDSSSTYAASIRKSAHAWLTGTAPWIWLEATTSTTKPSAAARGTATCAILRYEQAPDANAKSGKGREEGSRAVITLDHARSHADGDGW